MLLLTGLAGLAPAKRRPAALALLILATAVGCFSLFLSVEPLGMLLFLPCLLATLMFMPAMARPAQQEWTVPQLGLGVAVHIAAQFLKSMDLFAAAAAPVSWMFTIYLLAFLFSANRLMLADAGPAEARPLLLQNRKLLAVLCVLALLLANIGAIAAAVRAAIRWIVMVAAKALLWLSSLMQTSEGEGGGTPDASPFQALAETSEPSLFARIMEIVLYVLAVLALAAALFFAGKYLLRLLRRLYAALMARIQLYRQRISADYDDQSESLLDWGELRKTAADSIGRFRRRFLPVPWEKLSPDQRVRRVYALLLRRADTPDPARTAREMLQSGKLLIPPEAAVPAASLYERARYSSHPISAQEADELRKRAGV